MSDEEPEEKPEIDSKMMSELKTQIEEEEVEKSILEQAREAEPISLLDSTKVYSREELLTLLTTISYQRCGDTNTKDGRYTVGMVGYPNVGKSSVINVLCGSKKVGVAAQPGKTKHFQTLNLTQSICLCDCPGLVFPSFASSKSEMVCCGVLPID